MGVSRDHRDYQYVPPPARVRRAERTSRSVYAGLTGSVLGIAAVDLAGFRLAFVAYVAVVGLSLTWQRYRTGDWGLLSVLAERLRS